MTWNRYAVTTNTRLGRGRETAYRSIDHKPHKGPGFSRTAKRKNILSEQLRSRLMQKLGRHQ